jgi:hypothetical protein
MSYVIYNTETTVFPSFARNKRYATLGAARAARTRAHNKGLIDGQAYSIAEAADFHNRIEKTRVVKNLMSGKDVVEKVNTPYYCSPSSETYWSR